MLAAIAFSDAPASESERMLLERLRAGDESASESLVHKYTGHLFAVARRLLRNEDDARDAVQDAFLQAFRGLANFRADAQLSTWLHRIVVNAALMRLRSANRRPEVLIDDLLPTFAEDGHHADPVQSFAVDPEASLDRHQQRAIVRECVEQLPDPYRAAIVLRDFEELSTEETATILGITPNAAKIRLHRARQALRTLLMRRLAA